MRDTGLDGRIEILGIDHEDTRHLRKVDRDAAAERVDVSFERRSDAERDHWRPMARGRLQDRADFLCTHWKYDDIGLGGGVPRFAVAVMLELRGVGGAPLGHDRP